MSEYLQELKMTDEEFDHLHNTPGGWVQNVVEKYLALSQYAEKLEQSLAVRHPLEDK